jgi:hypothetical protein
MKKISQIWLQWFIGFNDAEGNFQVFPKKRVLKSGDISHYGVGCAYHLSLHSRDAVLIKDIHDKLNKVGVIYEYPNKPDCRLAVGDKNGLLYLFNMVFDVYPLLAKNQLQRYNFLKHCVTNDVKKFQTLDEFNKFKSMFLGGAPQLKRSALKKEVNIISLCKAGKLDVDN